MVADGEYAIIMAGPDGQSPENLAWRTTTGTTPGTDSFTNGRANTLAMEAAGLADHPAASYCLGYNGGGFDDWYLPAQDELSLTWANLAVLEGVMAFSSGYYWSSTQATSANSYRFWPTTGDADVRIKVNPNRVRPVRRILIPQE